MLKPEKLMYWFRQNSSPSILDFCRASQKSKPDKWTKLRIATHYINEANEKFNIIWEATMPKKKNNNNFGSTKFCAISLDTAQKDAMRKWLGLNGKDIDDLATNMVRDGWKSSFTWDADNDCFIASSTMRDEDNDNYDICVTSRSDIMWDALLLNYYKIYVLYNNKELPTERAKNSWG